MTPKPLPLDEARLSIEDGDTRIDRTILGAGTRVLTQEIPATKSAGVSLWVPVGSRDEGPRTAGSTHFLEHLLFKGTNKRSALDIAVAFDSVGGESNAETAREHTAYWARVRDADLDMAIETLTDMVTDSRLDEEDFSMERGVIPHRGRRRQRRPRIGVRARAGCPGGIALGREQRGLAPASSIHDRDTDCRPRQGHHAQARRDPGARHHRL